MNSIDQTATFDEIDFDKMYDIIDDMLVNG